MLEVQIKDNGDDKNMKDISVQSDASMKQECESQATNSKGIDVQILVKNQVQKI